MVATTADSGVNTLMEPSSTIWYGASEPLVIESVADLAAKLQQLRVVVSGNDPVGAGLWSVNGNVRWSLHEDQQAGATSFWTNDSWAGWNLQTPWWSSPSNQGTGPGLVELTPGLPWNLVDQLSMAAPADAGQSRYLAVDPSSVNVQTLLPIPEISVTNPDAQIAGSASLSNADIAFELNDSFWADFNAWKQTSSAQPTEVSAFWDSGQAPTLNLGALYGSVGFDGLVDVIEQDLALTIELTGVERYPLGPQWGWAEFQHQGTGELISLRLGDHGTSQADVGVMAASMAPAGINVYQQELDIITSFDLEPDLLVPWQLSDFLGKAQRAAAFDSASGSAESVWTLKNFRVDPSGSYPGTSINIDFTNPVAIPLGISSSISFVTSGFFSVPPRLADDANPLFDIADSAAPTLDVLSGSKLNSLISADLGTQGAGDFISAQLNLEYWHQPTGAMVQVRGGASPYGEYFAFDPWNLSALRTQIENGVVPAGVDGGISIDPSSTLELTLRRVWIDANSLAGSGNAEFQQVWVGQPLPDIGGGSYEWQRTSMAPTPSNILDSWSLDQLVSNIESLETITLSNLFADFDALPYLTGVRAMLVDDTSPVIPGDAAVAFRYQLIDDFGDGLSQLAILGDSVDPSRRYSLDITAESLVNGFNLEAADITLHYDSRLFNQVNAADIRIGGALPVANAVSIDHQAGTIRIAGASLSDLAQGDSINGTTPFASISFDFDEAYLATLQQNLDGSLWDNPLAFSISANADETILSSDFVDASNQLNRQILSLADLGRGIGVMGQDVTLYEATINLDELGDGLILGTDRVIGADAGFTNLVRSGDTLSASSEWLNVGNIQAANLQVQGLANANAQLAGYNLSASTINSGEFVDGVFDPSNCASTVLTADIKVTGAAGQVLDLSSGILELSAVGSDPFTNLGKGSKNLITFQGDLNYDGRVSMKDLAYLNAGAARQRIIDDQAPDHIDPASVARDVDADFNGRIDLADLAVLDADWGKTLHSGDESFVGSDSLSWTALDAQGDATWNNGSFKAQNAVEASADYVGSLESPSSIGVIGADGNTNANDGDLQGTYFQDPIAS